MTSASTTGVGRPAPAVAQVVPPSVDLKTPWPYRAAYTAGGSDGWNAISPGASVPRPLPENAQLSPASVDRHRPVPGTEANSVAAVNGDAATNSASTIWPPIADQLAPASVDRYSPPTDRDTYRREGTNRSMAISPTP